MEGDNIYIGLSIMNSVLGFLIAYTQIRYYLNNKNTQSWCWIKLALGVAGLYWGILYVFIIFQSINVLPKFDAVWFGRIFVRPALTITLGFIAAGGIIRWRSN